MVEENMMIQRKTRYSIIQDLFLLIAIITHILLYYNFFKQIELYLFSIVGISAVIWFGYYIKSFLLYRQAVKDNYLKQAIRDEYFTNINLKANTHGFTAILIICIFVILTNLSMSFFNINFNIPSIILSEIILLTSIITIDISKFMQIRR